jgi:hypothetical protein
LFATWTVFMKKMTITGNNPIVTRQKFHFSRTRKKTL